jgi:serine/threonine protein kinase
MSILIPEFCEHKKIEKTKLLYDAYTWNDVNIEDLIIEGYEIESPKYISIVKKFIKKKSKSILYSVDVYNKDRLFLKEAVIKIFKKKSYFIKYIEKVASLTSNPYFIKFYETFNLDNNWFIIADKINGNLHDLIQKNLLGEQDIKSIIKQLLEYIDIIDSQRRCHVTLKSEHIGYIYEGDKIMIRMFKTEFIFYDDMIDSVKISNYTDPDLIQIFPLQKIATYKIDMWCLGCIFHELVTGKNAFENNFKTNIETFFYIKQKLYDFEPLLYNNLSDPECFSDFISCIFLQRLSAKECLSHSYLS